LSTGTAPSKDKSQREKKGGKRGKKMAVTSRKSTEEKDMMISAEEYEKMTVHRRIRGNEKEDSETLVGTGRGTGGGLTRQYVHAVRKGTQKKGEAWSRLGGGWERNHG